LGFSAFGVLIPFDYVAHGAHLGGLFLGISYVRNSSVWERLLSGWRWPILPAKRPRSGSLARSTPWSGGRATTRNDSGTFISREVDPILDKISAQGFEALTEEERRILETARKMMK